MADIFLKSHTQSLLRNKEILFLGDSNVRAMYKDLLWLLRKNTLIDSASLKSKLEHSYEGDHLVKKGELHRGRDFQEEREFKGDGFKIAFKFLTKVYTKEIEAYFHDVRDKKKSAPDVIIINSCLWDISRWGFSGVHDYKDNLQKLMKLLNACLPEHTLVIWATTLPISRGCRGGFIIKQIEFLTHTLRFEVMEANLYAKQVVIAHGYDVLDLHFNLRMQIHRRAKDGIHWLPTAMRHTTNLLLTHVALSWNKPLPGNTNNGALQRVIMQAEEPPQEVVRIPEMPPALKPVPEKQVSKPKKKFKRNKMRGHGRGGRPYGSGQHRGVDFNHQSSYLVESYRQVWHAQENRPTPYNEPWPRGNVPAIPLAQIQQAEQPYFEQLPHMPYSCEDVNYHQDVMWGPMRRRPDRFQRRMAPYP